MTVELLEAIRNENLSIYQTSAQRLREDIGQEDEIARDYRGRLIYELIQNADDAMAGNQAAHFRVELHPDGLWFANSGRPLAEADIRGICGISASTKQVDVEYKRASIGHKGMGFKSVLEVSRTPEIYSTTCCFRFSEPDCLELLRGAGFETTHAPLMRLPWPITDSSPTWQRLLGEGMTTAFHLPFVTDRASQIHGTLTRALRALPETTFLFLKRLEAIEFILGDTTRSWTIQRTHQHDDVWRSTPRMQGRGLYKVIMAREHDNSAESCVHEYLVAFDDTIQIGARRGGLHGVAWENVAITEVSVAVCLNDDRPTPVETPLVHVFLPTAERMPYPFLVNGAFACGLSRQRIPVDDVADDYNAFLLDESVHLLTDVLIPRLCLADRRATVLLLQRDLSCESPLATRLHKALRIRLSTLPLVPDESGRLLMPNLLVVPAPETGSGKIFRELLKAQARLGERWFPSAEWCDEDVARVLIDHGATSPGVVEMVTLLSDADPARSTAQYDETRPVKVDPVLRVLEQLWRNHDDAVRQRLANAVRQAPLLPVEVCPDGSWRREVIGDRSCFYPPRSLQGELPLPGLSFLARSICWGELRLNERKEALHDEMLAWHGLFDIREFRFEEVMRASVLPAMALEQRARRSEFHDIAQIATICQLSGKSSQGGRLSFERLGSQRPLFNLTRLELPCRAEGGGVRWVSAYQVYLGADWIGEASVECLMETCAAAGITNIPDIPLLLGPDNFIPHLNHAHAAHATATDDGEVGLEEDEDAAIPARRRSRWLEFLTWIGVNRHLRLVHFHDINDRDTGWIHTARLARPSGWIFKAIPEGLWQTWRDDLEARLANALAAQQHSFGPHRFFYELHHLEHLDPFLTAAAADTSCQVSGALYKHLAAHWSTMSTHRSAIVALTVHSPRRRSTPRRANGSEKIALGDDFWLWRLKQAAFCPTSHGPRQPANTWWSTSSIRRKLDRVRVWLPTLEVDNPTGFADALNIRRELAPETFTLDDATALLVQLERAEFTDNPQGLRALRSIFRDLIELLVEAHPPSPQGAARLPTLFGGQLSWRPANQIFLVTRRRHARVDVPTFILEGNSRAPAILPRCFGVRLLDDALDHTPCPGDESFQGADLDLFRHGLLDRGPAILARLGTERQSERQAEEDARNLRHLLKGITPVTDLLVQTTLDGRPIGDPAGDPAEFFVERDNPAGAFILWQDAAWPPVGEHAERIAETLCEIFGTNWYEPFLALIQANDHQTRRRILQRAGVPNDLDEYQRRFDDEFLPNIPAPSFSSPRTAGEQPMVSRERTLQDLSVLEVKRPLHPLWPASALIVLGQPASISAPVPVDAPRVTLHERGPGAAIKRGHIPSQTDLSALDRLGMQVAMAFELRRLDRQGGGQVYDVSHPERIKQAWDELGSLFERTLKPNAISDDWPGFDILSIDAHGRLARMIELKSSGVSARTQSCTWNEWKSAAQDALRQHYFLYLVGNLRSDLHHNKPFIRTVQDPFGQLRAELQLRTRVERKVQLAVNQFREAEEEIIEVRPSAQRR